MLIIIAIYNYFLLNLNSAIHVENSSLIENYMYNPCLIEKKLNTPLRTSFVTPCL